MQNFYTKANSVHLCFPIKIRKLTNNNNDIDNNMKIVNNFFTHWIEEIIVTQYRDNVEILPTSSLCEAYQYSDLMLKNFPEKSCKRVEKLLLYSKKMLVIVVQLAGEQTTVICQLK